MKAAAILSYISFLAAFGASGGISADHAAVRGDDRVSDTPEQFEQSRGFDPQGLAVSLIDASDTYPVDTTFESFTSTTDDPLGPFSGQPVMFRGLQQGGVAQVYRVRLDFDEEVTLESIIIEGAAWFLGTIKLMDDQDNELARVTSMNSDSNFLQSKVLDASGITGRTFFLVELNADTIWRYRSNIEINFTSNVPAVRFNDVPANHWAYSFIESLALSGITAGCGNDNYCPGAPVTRAQMAVFLERGVNGSGFTPPAATGNVFLDVGAGDFAASFIEQLASDGITAGCGNNNYCPDADVTRGQMAVFLLRAKYGSSYSPPAATGIFGDVPLNYWAVHWIEQLAAEGITAGCGNGDYCPESQVTRDQMAVFLVRTFGL